MTFEKVYVVRLQNHLYEGFDGLLIFFRKDQYAVKVTMEEYIENWEIDGCEDVHEDLFDIEILEV